MATQKLFITWLDRLTEPVTTQKLVFYITFEYSKFRQKISGYSNVIRSGGRVTDFVETLYT